MSTGASSNTAHDKPGAQQATFLAEGNWKSPIECARAFYDKFTFRNTKAAMDTFRWRVRTLDSKKCPWAKAFHAETKTQVFLSAEKEYLDSKKIRKRTKDRQTLDEVASALAKKLGRGTLRSSFKLLETGNNKISGLAMTEITSGISSSQSPSLEHEAGDGLDNDVDDSASSHMQQRVGKQQQATDSDSGTAVEASPAIMESELVDGDTEVEASLATLESELSQSKAKNSPFYELVDYIYKKAQRKQIALPNIPNDLTPVHSEMFRLARDELMKPGDVMKKKHVFCLLSGIVNTLMPISRSLSISSEVEAASIAPALKYESHIIRTLQEELLAALYPDAEEPGSMDVSNLRRTVYLYLADSEQKPRKSKAAKERYAVLQVLTLILLWLANRKFDKPSPEHVFVSAWSDVFNALFQGANLRVIPGELTSGASKENRQLAEDEFGGETVESKRGRKVDLNLRVMVAGGAWKGEVAVFEGKPQVSDKTCQIQQQKSVRLNAAILSDLENLGLDISKTYLVVAETRALAVDFYTLKRHGSIFGAGRATDRRVWLPAHPTELKAFLRSDSLQVLLGFRTHKIQYASEAASALTAAPPSPFPVQDVGPSQAASTEPRATTAVLPHTTHPPPALIRCTTPPPRKRTRPFIVFSPSRSNKKRPKRRDGDSDEVDISEREEDE